MRKLIVAGGLIAAAAIAAKRLASSEGFDFAQMIERMPDDAPPKWMFRNITEIRENTERILELLEGDREAIGGR